MNKIYKFLFVAIIIIIFSNSVIAQNRFFSENGENRQVQTIGDRVIIPEKFSNATVNVQHLKNFLWSLPSENSVLYNRGNAPVMELPMPDGSMAKFRVWESSIQEPALAAKFNEIKTFAGQGIDDPYASIRFDYNPYFGFSAQILSPNGRIFIDPYARKDINNYISYYARDFKVKDPFTCGFEEAPNVPEAITAGPCVGTQLRTYRLAFSCTGEFAQAVGGGLAGPTHAAIVTGINRVTGVYEVELSIRLMLIANNDLIEYLNPATDPWLNDGSISELNSITGVINGVIGSANYDVGHLGCTASNAGVAGLGVVCGGSKGRGLTGGLNPVGDPYYIDYVAHEIGHQFNAGHSFNSNSCASTGGSYEPGSGTTIMAYAGICSSSENIQPFSDPIFHAISFDQIGNFVSSGGGSSCPVITATGNTLPIITSVGTNNMNVPINTPFVLTGAATDANGDPITYNWEGWDIGAAGSWPSAATSTTRPLFRTRLSKSVGERSFPDIRVIVANYPGITAPSAMDGLRGEVLPLVARTMKFRLTVRDNRAGGGGVVSSGDGCQGAAIFQVNAVGSTAFAITSPNGGESFLGGSTQTVTWNNAGTTGAPFNLANVNITLSTDGGFTYPIILAVNTPNDGSESVTFPSISTTTARVKVEPVGSIFFDISNANFTLTAPAPGFTFNSPAPVISGCPAPASLATTITASFQSGFTNAISLSASGNPGGTTVLFGTNPLTTGTPSSTVTLTGTNLLPPGSYTITVTGTASGAPVQNRDIVFTINPGSGPAITVQPANQIICSGQNASFSITSPTATGYQWQLSTDGGANYNNISNGGVYSGATTAILTITGATAGLNNNRYRCIASVQCGSTNSNGGVLTVNTAPAITSNPSNITLCVGSNHSFSVAATGTNPTYQWELSTNGGTIYNPLANGGVYSGVTTSSLTLTGITAGMDTYRYRCVVSGTCPSPATSTGAILNVNTTVAVTTQPENTAVCEGSNTSFTVAGSGSGIIYQWQVSTDGGANYNNLSNGGVYSGVTTASLNITGATFSLNNYRYRCLLSNATCTTPGISNGAILTVNLLPQITAQPQSVTICLGSNTSFTTAATGTGIGYQWQVSTDGGTNYSNIANGGVYAGATTVTLAITGATAAMNTYRYRCVVSGTCPPPATTNAAILTVINPVSITNSPVASVICSGSNTSFTVAGSSAQTIIYQWQVSTDGGTNFSNITNGGVYSGATTATLTITGTTTSLNTYRYRCNLSNATCTVPSTSGNALLTVRQLPTVSLVAAPLTTLLPGQSTTLTATPSASTGGVLTTTWLYNGAAPVPAITGNVYVANVEQVGTYQMLISETFTGPALVCSNQSTIVTITASASNKLFIFPSPNDGRFTVSYYNNGGTSTKRKISIFDSKGANVYNAEFSISGLYTLLPINLEKASRGIYYVVIGDANGMKLSAGKVHIR